MQDIIRTHAGKPDPIFFQYVIIERRDHNAQTGCRQRQYCLQIIHCGTYSPTASGQVRFTPGIEIGIGQQYLDCACRQHGLQHSTAMDLPVAQYLLAIVLIFLPAKHRCSRRDLNGAHDITHISYERDGLSQTGRLNMHNLLMFYRIHQAAQKFTRCCKAAR